MGWVREVSGMGCAVVCSSSSPSLSVPAPLHAPPRLLLVLVAEDVAAGLAPPVVGDAAGEDADLRDGTRKKKWKDGLRTRGQKKCVRSTSSPAFELPGFPSGAASLPTSVDLPASTFPMVAMRTWTGPPAGGADEGKVVLERTSSPTFGASGAAFVTAFSILAPRPAGEGGRWRPKGGA
jgi:hypothetical protein